MVVQTDWIKESHHLHGLAWSLAGLAAGAGITWLVREISSRVLGQEALGAGDVTLMAMIGAIVLARRDVLTTDIGTGDAVNQGLLEKSNTPLLIDESSP